MVKELGGNLDDAIAHFEASMSEDDVAIVKKRIEQWKASR